MSGDNMSEIKTILATEEALIDLASLVNRAKSDGLVGVWDKTRSQDSRISRV